MCFPGINSNLCSWCVCLLDETQYPEGDSAAFIRLGIVLPRCSALSEAPRAQPISVRESLFTSIRSVFARRLCRSTAIDTTCLQHAVRPETIKAGLVDRHDLRGPTEIPIRLCLQPRKPGQQGSNISSRNAILADLLASRCACGNQPHRFAQFQCHV